MLRNVRFLTYAIIASTAVILFVSWKRVIPASLSSSVIDAPSIPRGIYYRFDRIEAIPPPFRDAAPAIIAAIEKEGLNPAVYFVELRYDQSQQSLIKFLLWDARAFPIPPSRVGNPGAECRTVEFDSEKNVVTKIYGWK